MPTTNYPQTLILEQTQQALNRSRASVYRYANTSRSRLNPPFDPRKLNPVARQDPDEPIAFPVVEVERFAREVLGQVGIAIAVQIKDEAIVGELLGEILKEIQAVKELLLR